MTPGKPPWGWASIIELLPLKSLFLVLINLASAYSAPWKRPTSNDLSDQAGSYLKIQSIRQPVPKQCRVLKDYNHHLELRANTNPLKQV